MVGVVCALLGGGAVGGLQYSDARKADRFQDEVEDAVIYLLDGHWTPERAAHAADYYAFPLTAFYNAIDLDEAGYQAEAVKFWSTFEYVNVGVTRVQILEDSDYLGYVRVTVDATISRVFRNGGCKQTADSTYLLSLERLEVGYRIRSERETATPLVC
jgi:hypothetical protein